MVAQLTKRGAILPPCKKEKITNSRVSKTSGTPCAKPGGDGVKADPCNRSGQQQ
jgi:hypothetical protein